MCKYQKTDNHVVDGNINTDETGIGKLFFTFNLYKNKQKQI